MLGLHRRILQMRVGYEMNKKILHLSLLKKYFCQILTGQKRIERRPVNKYYKSRLLNKDGSFREYDEIRFINGYGNKRPWMRVEFQVAQYDGFFKREFRILLGEVIEAGNISLLKEIKFDNQGELI